MKIEVRDETLILLSEKALIWERHKLLIISDIHLGKAESLQAAGIPLPSGDHLEEFRRIEELLRNHDIEQVFILGDLIHQKNSWSPDLLKDMQVFFRQHEDTQWHLLIGNHERGSQSFLESLNLKLHNEDLVQGPFVFTHGHKRSTNALMEIRGHLHPCISLKEGPMKLNLPCFWLEKNRLTLPSFGLLTGGSKIRPHKNDRVFAIGETEVFEIP